MSNKEPKVTECCAVTGTNNAPSLDGTYNYNDPTRPAILMWREDYERLIAELEESRKWKPFARGYYKREGEVVHFATRGTYDDEGK